MTNATPNQAENTRYGYKNDEGHILHIATIGHDRDHVELAIKGVGDLGWRSLNIPATEAAGVALAILKAAGWPEGDPSSVTHKILADLRRVVEISEQFTKAADLTRRRDELALDLFDQPAYVHHPDVITYEDCTPVVRTAIDMIIQLQDEATK